MSAAQEITQKAAYEQIDGDFMGKDIVSVDQFTVNDVEMVMDEAAHMALMVHTEARSSLLADKLVANLFYEPSTRTFLSFEAAAKALGAETLAVQGVEYSSMAKGENLADTIRTVERYADVINIRHSELGAAALAASFARIPIINGGDGQGEHPTQALLDLFTIKEEAVRPPEEGLRVTMVGDLKYGRTVHSLSRLLAMYGTRLNYVSPVELQMPREIQDELHSKGVVQTEFTDLDEALAETDVLYVTRVQKERFLVEQRGEYYENLKNQYIINTETMEKASATTILMHPLPRLDEIHADVDNDPRAHYFDQVENGKYVRMALLAMVMGRSIQKA
jgi:aspartate carbamoyltransferase